MIQSHKITIPRTAHYYSIGSATPDTRRFWIVAHGYGQLARTFIRRFEGLDDGRTFVLAPEGLSKFYWGGFTGDPVASWMTRENRLDEIADYCGYLQELYNKYRSKMHPDVEIILLGFSQGTATQCRWVMQHFPDFHHLILWAGLLPDDLDFTPHRDYFASKKLYFVYGKKDPFLTDERLVWQTSFAKKNLLDFQLFAFDGEHVVDQEALKEFAGRYIF